MISVMKIERIIALSVAAAASAAACAPAPDVDFASSARGAQCGPTLDFVPINGPEGSGPWVDAREDGVALVNGTCTGVLIGPVGGSGPLVLTAGHCVALGDEALVAFNVEEDPDGAESVVLGEVIERADAPDYAVIELDADPQTSPLQLGTQPTYRLTVIQHPRGLPKVLATGTFAFLDEGAVHYDDLDTLVGSSGAPIINGRGRVLGLHAGGDCDLGGTNWGWLSSEIVRASSALANYALSDC